MAERVEPREAGEFFLNVSEKLDDSFPDLAYFRENLPVFFYPPFEQWFVFSYNDVGSSTASGPPGNASCARRGPYSPIPRPPNPAPPSGSSG